MANKSKKLSTGEITGIFIALIIFNVGIIIGAATVGVSSIMLLLMIWGLVLFSMIAMKAIILTGDRDIKNKDWQDVLLTSFVSVLLIVGSSLLVAQPTIIGRAFENTVGYLIIDSEELTNITKSFFKSTNGANYNYNLIATQLFSDDNRIQFDTYLSKMVSDDSQFKGVSADYTEGYDRGNAELPINKLYEMVVKKYNLSKGVIASLATIAAMYTCFMPMKNPWINI
jgi:hypothetical protein